MYPNMTWPIVLPPVEPTERQRDPDSPERPSGPSEPSPAETNVPRRSPEDEREAADTIPDDEEFVSGR